MLVAQSSVGFFGKLPCNGDFLERRVPRGFLEVWDPWLQHCVHTSREILQESWLSSYLSSPLWRFVLSASVCGSGAYAGVLAPSVDRVGRYFPLTIVTQIDVDFCSLQFAAQHTAWFGALESLVLTALEDTDLSLEWFDAQVAGLAIRLDEAGAAADPELVDIFERSSFPAQGSAWRAPLRSASGLQDAINAFAFRELAAQLRPISLWWTEGSSGPASSWLTLRSLPTPAHFGAMLDGHWVRDGWSDLGGLAGTPGLLHEAPAAAAVVDTVLPQAEALGIPQVTLPELQLSAIETNKVAFVIRPEIGLWAVAATNSDATAEAVRMIADALQQLGPAPLLSGMVEALRQTVLEVHRRLRHQATRDVQSIEASTNLNAILVVGAECAFLSAGQVQRFRIRKRNVDTFDDVADGERAALPDSGSLMELLTADPQSDLGVGAPNFKELHADYERLQREDQWILCARPVITSRVLDDLISAAASGMPINVRVIAAMLAGAASPHVAAPLFTLEV